MSTIDYTMDNVLDQFWAEIFNDIKPCDAPLKADYAKYKANAKQAIEAYIAERIVDELEKVGLAADDSYRRSGQGSRTQWSKQNETRGEAYSRSQGFKSAMLTTRRVVDTRIKELKSNER